MSPPIYAITFTFFVWSVSSTFTTETTEDPCEYQQCELYPNAICLSSRDTPHSNRTLFMDDSGAVIDDRDCDCAKNHKLDNEQCLESNEDTASNGEYYIAIDLSFDVEQSTSYQNQRDVLFSDISECVGEFISAVTSIDITSHPLIQSYSHSNRYQQDNDFFDDETESTDAKVERFHFTFAVHDINIDNSTFVYDSTTDTYQEAVRIFSTCALLWSEKADSEGFKSVSNARIVTQLLKESGGSNIGAVHLFAFTSFAVGVLLMMKKGILVPLARFWCNFFACCHHWHCCYCYNPCTQATKDCGFSCLGFGCGCVNGCCPGFSMTFFCWQCHC